ncbi:MULTISPECIES: ferritin-like domain-containing protein [Spirosoma]|uniref:Ferritin-like domain-containing protein n=1 Tax=Spirosoma liriopis TaxID=2937440 RepID=A0ABT0HMN6_9BACT|nr:MULTISPECIES: ferritin-like domain-containing protein [Spirosoma]MCK8493431.1 ferritin-like domain-containing protein [Spirosoma liriopis]UHG92812.1 ferritin-like domain-containing protein [Spirosoma oryzicola]
MATFGERIANFFGGNDSATQEGLHGLFVTELKNIYYAEKQAVDALGEQADASTTDEVRSAFLQHQDETRNQVTRLEQVFNSIGVDVEEGACAAIDGLADDAQLVVSNTESGSLTRDAGLIIAGQKIEHHEIAAYGSAVTLAQVLGYTEAARLLEQTLDEEKNTDKKLTALAESFINSRAASESDNDSYRNDNDRDDYSQGGVVSPDGTRYSDSSYGSTTSTGSGYTNSGTGYTSNGPIGGTSGI